MIERICGYLGLYGLQARLLISAYRRAGKPLKLYIGCGNDKRAGWINIDADKAFRPDILADAKDLSHLGDGAADELECCHLFEHLTYSDAIEAIKEWHRILRTGGRLFIELPDFKKCAEIIYKNENKDAVYYAMMGLFGQIPGDMSKVSVYQLHKYGWTFEGLSEELEKIGFREVRKVPVTQSQRPATKYGRDMRLECIK